MYITAVEYTTIQQDTSCADAKETCTALRCPFGVTKHVNSNNCEICSCYNPCTEYVCQPGNQCAIEYYSDEQSQVSFRPVCRLRKFNIITSKIYFISSVDSKCNFFLILL